MAASIDDMIGALAERVTPELRASIDRAFELRFVGDPGKWGLDLREEAPSVTPSARPADPVCGLGLPVDDLEQLLEGRVTMGVLFQSGRLRVFDDIGDAMKLEALFAAR